MAQSGNPPREPASSSNPTPDTPNTPKPPGTSGTPNTPDTANPALNSVPDNRNPSLWRRFLGRSHQGHPDSADESTDVAQDAPSEADSLADNRAAQQQTEKANYAVEELDPDDPSLAPVRRVPRKVVPELPRALTFKRQQSELRDNLLPVEPTLAERRAFSTDRRLHSTPQNGSESQSEPRTSATNISSLDAAVNAEPFLQRALAAASVSTTESCTEAPSAPSLSAGPIGVGGKISDLAIASTSPFRPLDNNNNIKETGDHTDWGHLPRHPEAYPPPYPQLDTLSMTTSQYDQLIHEDLERVWILNLSMYFRDGSKREKFFVTYRQHEHLWRRVTISLDYRAAPDNSLELDLEHTKFQREKNAKIYEAIRESLQDIQFYSTVTNLKLQTTDGRLHVHVVEDVNEIIPYPTVRAIQHLRCRRIKEREIQFDSHMSGFVYKVNVHGKSLIKKEIPGPDTVDEFLYEINALTQLQRARHVIEFYGVVVDDREEHVKGLLISYAQNGALIDMIFDNEGRLTLDRREKWARQIVEGLSEIHEAGFVQGDFTLSNIVIDHADDAKIIDINRRGCPIGWEPPEATPLIESGQHISMYIGVKSDLYQLGMVLWALATQDDEPEAHSRPLRIPSDANCPRYFRTIVDTCLADDPRLRAQAINLVGMFPRPDEGGQTAGSGTPSRHGHRHAPSLSIDDVSSTQSHGAPAIKTVNSPPLDWNYKTFGHTYVDAPQGLSHEPYYFPMRGRSPPSPIASNMGGESARRLPTWSAYSYDQSRSEPSTSDVGDDELDIELPGERSVTPRTNNESVAVVEREKCVNGDMNYSMRASESSSISAMPNSDSQDEAPWLEENLLEKAHLPQVASVLGSPISLAEAAEIRPDLIPLPTSPLEESTEAEAGGAAVAQKPNRLEPANSNGSGGGGQPQGNQQGQQEVEAGSTEPEAQFDRINQPFPSFTAGPATDRSLVVEVEARRTDSRSRSVLTGQPVEKEAAHAGMANSAQQQQQQQNVASDPARSASPMLRGTPPSPGSELPDDLKGIGARYDQTNEEAVQDGGCMEDDLCILTNTATPEAMSNMPETTDSTVADAANTANMTTITITTMTDEDTTPLRQKDE